MGSFSYLAAWRNWENLEEFFNPCQLFQEVHIVAMDDDYEYESVRFGTLTIHPVPSGRVQSPLLRNLDVMWRSIRCLSRLLHSMPVDLVAQIYGGPLKFGLPAVVAARSVKVPCIVSLHSDYARAVAFSYPTWLRPTARFFWRIIFKYCTHVRSVSASISDFPLDFGLPAERITVIPNKEDIEKFTVAPSCSAVEELRTGLGLDSLSEDPVIFLTVGQLKPAKNLPGMLRAFASAVGEEPALVYLIVGDGPQEGELRRLAEAFGVSENVRLLGRVSHRELRCVYRLADVLLFATHYEGQSRVIMEALMASLPIICANYGQVCEVVRDGQDGLWVDPSNQEQIASAILRLARNEPLRRRCSTHDAFDPEEYSIERVGEREAALYAATIRSAARR